MGTDEKLLTKDDRWDVVITEKRVYETNLLLLWPDNIYAEQIKLKPEVGEQPERHQYLFDTRDLG